MGDRLLLDLEDRQRLQVLKAATEPNAAVYVVILSALVAAKERYRVQVRPRRPGVDDRLVTGVAYSVCHLVERA